MVINNIICLKVENEKYDYRKFNLKTNNKKLKGLVLEIKNGYEVDGELLIKENDFINEKYIK